MLYLVTGAASSSILPSPIILPCLQAKKKNIIENKIKTKQTGTVGYFQLSLLPPANVPCASTQFKAGAFSLSPSIRTV